MSFPKRFQIIFIVLGTNVAVKILAQIQQFQVILIYEAGVRTIRF